MRWRRASAAALVALWFLPGCTGENTPTPPADPTSPSPGTPVSSDSPPLSPPSGFTDVTSAAGIDFVSRTGAEGEKLLPETMGGGCAFLDHDADGDADIVLVGGTSWPWDKARAPKEPGSLALYENDGHGVFTDATIPAGLDRRLHGMGPAVGDIDGDGDDDLYVTAVGPNVLFRNEGGYFVDGTAPAGVAGPSDAWSTAAGFLDVENDGDLDLLVGNYVRWSRETDLAGDRRLLGIPGRAYAPPMAFDGAQPLLFVNRGGGVFDERGQDAGLHVKDAKGKPTGKTLAYHFVDLDGDRVTDVFAANDTSRNFLFINDGSGSFTEEGVERGVAYDRMGRPTGAMGVDGGVLADGRHAIFVGNFAGEMSSAYVSPPSGEFFEDETVAVGVGADTRDALTFGLLFLDVDLDGRRDLLQINGHLEPAVDGAPGTQAYAQAPQLFLGTGSGAGEPWMRPVPTQELGDLGVPVPGRGVACADIDGDGDLDLLVTQVDGPARLLRNDMAAGAHWLRVVLRGRPGFPTALGAVVELNAGGVTQYRRVDTTRGYLGASERTLTFGLGELSKVDAVRVTWPDGTVSSLVSPGIDQLVTLVQPVDADDVQRELNLGKAQLEAGRLGAALSTLEVAAQLAPDSAPTWRNLARAHMAANDPTAALAALEHAESVEPGHVAADWIRAMALMRLERPAEALPFIESVVRRDPSLAAARFQLATALAALGRADVALIQLREAVRLDASHAAAHYQLAVACRRAGDMDGFRAANRDFLRLRALYGDAYDTPLRLEACRYTEAEAAGQAVAATGGRVPAEPSMDLRFVAADDALLGDAAQEAAAVGILSMDEHGRYTLLVARPDGALMRLDPREGGGFTAHEVARSLGELSGLSGLAIGNYLDDSPDTLQPGTVPPQRPDVFLFGPDRALLLQQQDDGSFRDVTGRAGLDAATGTAARWVDYEHDGDLDLAVVGADGLSVFVNLGDGGFERSTDIPPMGGAGTDVVAVDFDDNGAVDFAVTGPAQTVRILNRQAGRFELPPDPPGPWPAALRVLAEDLDLDGRVDAVLVSADGLRFVFDGVPGTLRPAGDLTIGSAVLFDPDGDGWLDLALVGADAEGHGRVVVLRNGGRGPWTEWPADVGRGAAWSTDGMGTPAPAGFIDAQTADLDGDGDADLLLRDADDRLHALRTDGGEASPLLKLRLLSLMSPSGGLGARVEVRQGGFYTSRIVQVAQPVEIGVGGRAQLDSVLAVWPYGVVDTVTDVPVDPDGTPLAIIVLEKADTGSCPFLFVWDGQTRRFINDLVGSGATDLPASREALHPVNPHEIVTVGPGDAFPLVAGAWDVAITSELREVAYFDEVALMVVDHPVGTELASTHRLRGPPFPENRVLALGGRVPLRHATGSDGIDRTDALRERDGVHGAPGPVLPPPLRGVCKPMTLELDFGPLDTTRALVLALSGFIEFGTASTLIGQSQRSDVPVIWPELEARDDKGVWHPVETVVGLPGGKARDLTVELDGLLPGGVDRLRLTTTFQLHWDRAALFENVSLPADAVTEVRPTSADLRWRGFSDLAVRAPGQPRRPDYDAITQTPPWRVNLSGWCTRYGDVLPLLLEEDGMLIVLASGDEMVMRLPAADLPPVPEGCERTLMWRSVGYNKEADPNNAGAGRVWPLGPDTRYGRTDEEEDAWRLEWNTRWLPPDVFRPVHSGTR